MSKKVSIGVQFSVNDIKFPIRSDVTSKYDKDGNLVIEFLIGKAKLDKVKLIFNKKEYLDIQDE